MWSFTDPFWEMLFRWATISAFVLAGFAAIAAFVSAWVGYKITDATQKEADRKIDEAAIRIAEARAQSNRAQSNAASANEAAAKANERAATLEQETEKLRAENLKLTAQIAPRRLNESQRSTIGNALLPFSGKTVMLRSYSLDTEAVILGKQLLASFNAAKIGVIDALMTDLSGGSISLGIHVTGSDKGLSEAIIGILRANNLQVSSGPGIPASSAGFRMGVRPSVNPDATVFVGAKPIVP